MRLPSANAVFTRFAARLPPHAASVPSAVAMSASAVSASAAAVGLRSAQSRRSTAARRRCSSRSLSPSPPHPRRCDSGVRLSLQRCRSRWDGFQRCDARLQQSDLALEPRRLIGERAHHGPQRPPRTDNVRHCRWGCCFCCCLLRGAEPRGSVVER